MSLSIVRLSHRKNRIVHLSGREDSTLEPAAGVEPAYRRCLCPNRSPIGVRRNQDAAHSTRWFFSTGRRQYPTDESLAAYSVATRLDLQGVRSMVRTLKTLAHLPPMLRVATSASSGLPQPAPKTVKSRVPPYSTPSRRTVAHFRSTLRSTPRPKSNTPERHHRPYSGVLGAGFVFKSGYQQAPAAGSIP